MIFGIGIDLIETHRVQEKILKEQGFREYVFSPAEIEYCEKQTKKFQHYAARFAAKEALIKAGSSGWSGNFAFTDISLLPDVNGKPGFVFTQAMQEEINGRGKVNFHVTLSHLQDISVAMVVIEIA